MHTYRKAFMPEDTKPGDAFSLPSACEHAVSSPFNAFSGGSDSKASVYNVVEPGLSAGLGKSPGEGNGNPLQYYCLEDPMDRGTR